MLSVDDLANEDIIRKEFLLMALKNVEEGRSEPGTLKDATTLVDVTGSLIVSDHAREWCKLQYPGHSNGCPNYGRKPECPPAAPPILDFMDLGLPHFFLIQPFDLSTHAEKLKRKHPGWTEKQCRNSRYWQKRVVSRLRRTADRIIREHPGLCYTVIPEAMGVFVLATARRMGIPIRRIPGRFVFKIALIGFSKSPGKIQVPLDQFCHEAPASSLSDTSTCQHEWHRYCKSEEYNLWMYVCKKCGRESLDPEYDEGGRELVQGSTKETLKAIRETPKGQLGAKSFFCWIIESKCTAEDIKRCYSMLSSFEVSHIVPTILLSCKKEEIAEMWINKEKQYHGLLESPFQYTIDRCKEIKEAIPSESAQWNWDLTPGDIQTAYYILENEAISLTPQSLFKGAVYCLLSASENFTKQVKIFTSLLNRNLDTPGKMLKNWNQVRKLIKKTRFPNQRESHLKGFIKWWIKSDLPQRILEDAQNGRNLGYELRDELSRKAPGMGMKCSSLLLIKCRYDNVVPVDIWVIRFLRSRGHDIPEPDYRRISGLKDKDYLKYEAIFSEIGREEYEISPATFQAAIWAKNSFYNRSGISPEQIVLEGGAV